VGRCAPRRVVIYESTVYPGLHREVCVPFSSACRTEIQPDSRCYSPERSTPETARTATTIPQVTSGSTAQVAEFCR